MRTPSLPFFRRNSFINTSPVRVIAENGDNLGLLETSEALKIAYEKNLDLVEVAPNEKPPVCRIMSWSKFKYDLSKKHTNSKGKTKELKEMWFTPYISSADREHKLNKVADFLKKKHPVKLTIRVRGRVQEVMVLEQMKTILTLLSGKFETDSPPRHEGRNLVLTIFPTKSVVKDDKTK